MSETKHTPGPWIAVERISPSENHRGYRIGAKTFFIAEVMPLDEDGIEGGANARLIAAAPELLEALRASLAKYVELAASGDCGNWNPEEEAHVVNARAAIAKAEGA